MTAVVAVLLTLGCTPQGGVDHPPTFGVTGTVTLDGAPVEGATVAYVPSGSGNPAVGKTDASGKYALKSFGSADGATPGQYKVTIAQYSSTAPAAAGAATPDGEMPAGYGAPAEGADEGAKNKLPAKYASQVESGLSATVTEDASKNVFDFKLEGAK